MVLFHQRAVAAFPEHALSARLRYGAPPLFLALPFAVAVSLERVFSGRGQAQFQAQRPGRKDAPARAVLDRLYSCVFHFFNHAGILFDALLSSAGFASGFGYGGWR